MTENNARVIPTINAVDNFNPADFTRQLPNEDGTMSLYLDVKYRLLWFRLHRPNGKIDSEIIHVDDKSAVVCCKLYADRGDAPDQYVAKSSAQRFVTQDRFGDRYLETAETAAMGRVLAAAGYGTQFCGTADMFGDIMVDHPYFELSEDSFVETMESETVEVQVDELVSAFLCCKGKWEQIDPDRTMELLNILIDEKVNDEGGHGYRVVERLVELGFSKKELMVLKFAESDIDRAMQEGKENV